MYTMLQPNKKKTKLNFQKICSKSGELFISFYLKRQQFDSRFKIHTNILNKTLHFMFQSGVSCDKDGCSFNKNQYD